MTRFQRRCLEALDTGVYGFSAGGLQVTVANDADGKVAADAVRVVRVDQ